MTNQHGVRPELVAAPTIVVVGHPVVGFVGAKHALTDADRWVAGRVQTRFLPGVFDSPRVSRQHAQFLRSDRGVMVADLGSRNGTLVDGQLVDGPTPIDAGTVIEIGRITLMLVTAPISWVAPSQAGLAGVGPALASVIEQVGRVASRETPVLLLGETGVGKERIAALLHERSGVRGELVALNCGAVGDALVHSELFGHVAGAFSGARERRAGLVRAAADGTLLLDELGDCGSALQQSLLRLVETREYRAVGSDHALKATCRFVAAAQPALEVAVGKTFRADLFNRLARWTIRIPPLRERPEDIIPIAQATADRLSDRPVRFSATFSAALAKHSWTGNVRELQAVIERAVVEAGNTDDDCVLHSPTDFVFVPTSVVSPHGSATESEVLASPVRRVASDKPSADTLAALFSEHQGSVRAVATALNVPRKTVYRWASALALDLDQFRG